MNIDHLIKHIKWAEGEGPRDSRGRFYLYKDSVDKWTFGWGHNVDDNGIDEDVAEHQLRNDIDSAIEDCRGLDYWFELDSVRQLVVCDLVFNMGLPTWKTFIKAQSAIREGNYNKAAEEMEDSRWHAQTGRRARKLVRMMRTGMYGV